MPLHTTSLVLTTYGDSDIIDITQRVQDELAYSPFSDGQVTVFVPGSTGGVITLESEPGMLGDMRAAFERWSPGQGGSRHGGSRGGGNGHPRALGPSLSVPFKDRQLTLGAWQQIAFVDFDSRPRKRVLILQIMGE